jgi:hypothetical protein
MDVDDCESIPNPPQFSKEKSCEGCCSKWNCPSCEWALSPT